LAALTWSDSFDDPIPLPNGREIVTLEDAAKYIQKLPKAEQDADEWLTAVHVLIEAAEGRIQACMRGSA
jgi:hypothetical protein